MAPDQGSVGTSTAFTMTNSVMVYLGFKAAAAVLIDYDDNPEKEFFEPFIPTSWKLESKRYDRINADRKYLSEVARAKRHFGFKKHVKKHVKKHSGRRHKR